MWGELTSDMHESFYVYTSTLDCAELFPQNFNGEHNVQLSEEISLCGNWACGLVEFQLSATPSEPVYVCCDLAHESFVGDFNIPVLRETSVKTIQFTQVVYVPLKKKTFQTLKVFVRTLRNEPLPQALGINQGNSYGTLHFRKND